MMKRVLLALAILGALVVTCADLRAQSGESATGSSTAPLPQLFDTADQCMGCHNGLVTPSGEDVSIGSDWRASMMANSARDPYWQAAVRREALAHPSVAGAIQDECSTCHMPMARLRAHQSGRDGEVFSHLPVGGKAAPTREDLLAADGVSCTMCHQIGPEKLGTEESFVGGFVVDTRTPWNQREIFGPFVVDSGRSRIMHSATGFRPVVGEHLQSSELCATCHTLYTHARGPDGEVVGELPEQVPYLEWRHSDYPGEQSCQDCHMPVVADSTAVTGVLGQARADVNRHSFRGGNFFMLGMLNRYRDELGVTALPQELTAAQRRTERHLEERSARLSVEDAVMVDGTLTATVSVTNLAGHKLPTAYPSRRAWLRVLVRDAGGRTVFESGAFDPSGAIAENDNDADPRSFEPHYAEITSEEEVQIYEAIMADYRDRVTTGLIAAVRFVKDNRILPRGFDKQTADPDIAVRGTAAEDDDFTGGSDRVRYRIPVNPEAGPFRVEAELWYQPIAFRWAENLLEEDAAEIDRFVRYYRSMSHVSATILARAAATAASAETVAPPGAGARSKTGRP